MKNRVRLIIAVLCFLLIIVATRSQAPSIISLSPPTAVVGTAGITLTITGQAFTSHSVAYWNGSSRTTTFVSANQITAAITTADLAAPTAAQITVEDSVSGLVSIPVSFNVLGQLATVTSWYPTQFTAGSTINVNVYGQQFAANATVLFDSIPETTTYVSSTQLIATVNGGDIGYTGQHKIAVYNGAIPTSPATAQFSPRPVNFGSVGQGVTSGVVTVTLRNSGGASLTLETPYFTFTGANAADFANTGAGSCTSGGTVTGSGGTCTITLTFTPSTNAAESANLNVSDSAVGSPQVVALSGTGSAGAVTIAPSPYTYPITPVGTTSAATVFTLINSSGGTITLSTPAATLTGTNASDFAISAQTCTNGGTVTNGSTCTVSVTFTPTLSATTETATLNLNDTYPGSPQTVALSGPTPGLTAILNLTPNPVLFGTIQQSTTSSVTTLTAANTGNTSMTLATPYYSIAGNNAADFSNTGAGTCTNGGTLTAGGSCTVTLTFTPSTANPESGSFTFFTTATNSVPPRTANLEGSGSSGTTGTGTSLLGGMTPASFSIPSGWTLSETQDFESTIPGGQSISGTITNLRSHSGSKSLFTVTSSDQATVAWFGPSSLSTDVYESHYEYLDNNAAFNDELFISRLFRGSGGVLYQEIIVDRFGFSFNTLKPSIVVEPQSQCTGAGCSGVGVGVIHAFYGPAPNEGGGAWHQFETWWHPNTSGNSDGFVNVYRDAQLLYAANAKSLNGTISMSGATVEVGGVYTKLLWTSNGTPTGTCTQMGFGLGIELFGGGQTFAKINSYCGPLAPTFNHYLDDIIVMHK
ncbi:MAG TPA: choice-of-anchor D domain-containing protein [Candidatus Binatia bacterium]|nr:choice-of-anchor D domain-containing protein [Candidatus Binatia bacterium]